MMGDSEFRFSYLKIGREVAVWLYTLPDLELIGKMDMSYDTFLALKDKIKDGCEFIERT
jgi:hypothetical protein